MAGRAILTADELDELRYLRECGFTQAELARCFYVHQTTISIYLGRIGDPLETPLRYSHLSWKWAA